VQLFGSLSQTSPVAGGTGGSGQKHVTDLHVVGDRTLAGAMVEPRNGGYPVFFRAEFDRPFTGFGTWSGATVRDGSRDTVGTEDGAYLTFDTTADPTVAMRVGISSVDAAGAAGNLAAEAAAGTTTEALRARTHDAWNARLHDIEVTGRTTADQQTFYSMLYRALGMPALFDDADGRYRGFDDAVHRVRPGEHHYTDLSIWDTYKTQAPLLALIEPAVAHDVAVSLLDDYDQSGQIPKWVDGNREYGIEGGDSGSAVVADAVSRGLLRGPEAARAYAALRDQATRVPPAGPAREHLDEIVSRGWVGFTTNSGRPVADTVEYAVDDAAILPIARRLGTPADAALFSQRAGGWRNLLYPGSGSTDPNRDFVRPRHADGTYADPDTQNGVTVPWSPLDVAGYQEASGWQATFGGVPQDVAGYARTLGAQATLDRLDTFFSSALSDAPYGVPNANGENLLYYGNQYAPGNETDLPAPWYYDVLGRPESTSKVVRQVLNVFNGTVDAFPGNDDAGSMASWWVAAALGLYGGVAQGTATYAVNSPTFPHAVIHLGSPDRAVVVDAPAASVAAKYITALHLDAAALNRSYVTTCDLQPGRTLTLDLAATPGSSWATAPDSGPPSVSDPAGRPDVESCLDSAIGPGALPSQDVPEAPYAVVLLAAALVPVLLLARRRRRTP